MSLVEQITIKKEQEFLIPEFESGNDKEYKMEAIRDIAVYTKQADRHLPELYNLVVWKSYLKKKNTREPFLSVMHLRKMLSTFHKNSLKKPTATSALLDSAPLIVKPTIQFSIKRKRGQLPEYSKKCTSWGIKKEVIGRNTS